MLGSTLAYVAIIAWAALVWETEEFSSTTTFVSLTLLQPLHLLLLVLRCSGWLLERIGKSLDRTDEVLSGAGRWMLDQVDRLEPHK
jgi:hypothetical protein